MPLRSDPYKLETQRLFIRCYEPGGVRLLDEAINANLDHLRPWMPWAREEPKSLDARAAIIRQFRGQFDLGQDFAFGIFDKMGKEQLGATGLHIRNADRDIREIGYWIGEKHINRGYATEAVSALIRVGFELEGLARIEIHCTPQNVRSSNIPRKLGFTHEATLKNYSTDSEGRFMDKMIWSLRAEEYEHNVIRQMPVKAYDFIGRE